MNGETGENGRKTRELLTPQIQSSLRDGKVLSQTYNHRAEKREPPPPSVIYGHEAYKASWGLRFRLSYKVLSLGDTRILSKVDRIEEWVGSHALTTIKSETRSSGDHGEA
ncbi:hypothetical protein FRC16_006138, partial [Serendipita sp. 398]